MLLLQQLISGSICFILGYLLARGIHKLHADEWLTKIADAETKTESMVLFVNQAKQSMESQRQDIHKERGMMHLERLQMLLQAQNPPQA